MTAKRKTAAKKKAAKKRPSKVTRLTAARKRRSEVEAQIRELRDENVRLDAEIAELSRA